MAFAAIIATIYIQDYRLGKTAKALYEAERIEDADKRIEALEEVVKKYGSTHMGIYASFELASNLFEKGDYEKAAAGFGELAKKIRSKPMILTAAIYREAESLYKLGKFDEAAGAYIRASEVNGSLVAEDSLYMAAYCYEKAGKFNLAKDYYTRSMETAKDSELIDRSQERLLWLVAHGEKEGS